MQISLEGERVLINKLKQATDFVSSDFATLFIESPNSRLYQNSFFTYNLKAQMARKVKPKALFSDIDDTLLFKATSKALLNFKKLLFERNIPVCYITGQTLSSIISNKKLFSPDLYLTSLGTEIWIKKKNGIYVKDTDYENLLLKFFNKSVVFQNALIFEGKIPNLKLQKLSKVADAEDQIFKVSFNYSGDIDQLKQVITKIRQKMGRNVGVVYTRDYNLGKGFCIDLIPKIYNLTGKALPIIYLKKRFNNFTTLVAGNGGNDIDMLFYSDSYAIAIGSNKSEINEHYLRAKNLLIRELYSADEKLSGPDAIVEAFKNFGFLN